MTTDLSSLDDETCKFIRMEDGRTMMKLRMPKDKAAKIFEACNLVSEELGRPVSLGEALAHMAKLIIEDDENEHEANKED